MRPEKINGKRRHELRYAFAHAGLEVPTSAILDQVLEGLARLASTSPLSLRDLVPLVPAAWVEAAGEVTAAMRFLSVSVGDALAVGMHPAEIVRLYGGRGRVPGTRHGARAVRAVPGGAMMADDPETRAAYNLALFCGINDDETDEKLQNIVREAYAPTLALVEELVGALRPFAEAGIQIPLKLNNIGISLRHLLRARAVLAKVEALEKGEGDG